MKPLNLRVTSSSTDDEQMTTSRGRRWSAVALAAGMASMSAACGKDAAGTDLAPEVAIEQIALDGLSRNVLVADVAYSDADGRVDSRSFYIDNDHVQSAPGGKEHSAEFRSQALNPGAGVLKVIAYDNSGNSDQDQATFEVPPNSATVEATVR